MTLLSCIFENVGIGGRKGARVVDVGLGLLPCQEEQRRQKVKIRLSTS